MTSYGLLITSMPRKIAAIPYGGEEFVVLLVAWRYDGGY
jgi:hypothetical protein